MRSAVEFDVTGNFTGFFVGKLAGDGFVIGLDNSLPMIERAIRDNGGARAVYMRADALSLPFDDGSFDVVCCFAARSNPCAPGTFGENVLQAIPLRRDKCFENPRN